MRYILGVIGIVIFLIIAVVIVATRGPSQPDTTTPAANKRVILTDYKSKPATVIITIRGEVKGDEERQGIRITVSDQERVLEILRGYNETIENRHRFENNDNAFTNFLSALDIAGFSIERPTVIKDDSGVCPLGKRYDYKLQDGTNEVFRLWDTSCGGKIGSFAGNGNLVRRLFANQIPDYKTLTRPVEL